MAQLTAEAMTRHGVKQPNGDIHFTNGCVVRNPDKALPCEGACGVQTYRREIITSKGQPHLPVSARVICPACYEATE